MNKLRFFNKNEGSNKDFETRAFGKAVEICGQHQQVKKIILLISNNKTTSYIDRIFGKENLKAILKGNGKLDDGTLIEVRTVRNISDDTHKNIIVAFGIDSPDLFKLDSFRNTVAIVAHQWSESAVEDWAKSWEAIEIETNKTATSTSLPSPIVCEAFRNLTSCINLSTGIQHDSDANLCKTFIRTLRKYKVPMDSIEISSYLISKLNWESRHANEVVKLIDKVNSGGYFHGGDKTGLQKHFDRWQGRLKEG